MACASLLGCIWFIQVIFNFEELNDVKYMLKEEIIV